MLWRSVGNAHAVEHGFKLRLCRGPGDLGELFLFPREVHEKTAHGGKTVPCFLPAEGSGGVGDLVGDVLAAGAGETMQELAAEIAELHHVAVDLIVSEELHAFILRHFVLVKAVPDVGIDEVCAFDGAAIVGDLPRAAGEPAVLFEDLLVIFVDEAVIIGLKTLRLIKCQKHGAF